jgi:hypothetical protein
MLKRSYIPYGVILIFIMLLTPLDSVLARSIELAPDHTAGSPILAFDCVNVTEIPEDECLALVAVFDNLGGNTWLHNDGWKQNNSPCSWYGVVCTSSGVTSNVTKLVLPANELSGTVPKKIRRLTQLTHLDISGNDGLQEALPSTIVDLNLTTLYFDGTNVCEPPDSTFQDWLAGIPDLKSTGVQCIPTPTPTATQTKTAVPPTKTSTKIPTRTRTSTRTPTKAPTNTPFVIKTFTPAPATKTKTASPTAIVPTFTATTIPSATPVEKAQIISEGLQDLDGDGHWDALVIQVQVETDQGGPFEVFANLISSTGVPITGINNDLVLEPGLNTITLLFDGSAIFASGYDGPYTIENLIITPKGFSRTPSIFKNLYTTQAYSIQNFSLAKSPQKVLEQGTTGLSKQTNDTTYLIIAGVVLLLLFVIVMVVLVVRVIQNRKNLKNSLSNTSWD